MSNLTMSKLTKGEKWDIIYILWINRIIPMYCVLPGLAFHGKGRQRTCFAYIAGMISKTKGDVT